jgi:hypothetical protein
MKRRLSLAVGAALLAWPGWASAQQLGGGAEFELPLLRLGLGLALCTIVAFAAALALRHFMRGGGPIQLKGLRLAGGERRQVRVLESHRLSPHADICVFSCQDRTYTVIVTGAGATIVRDEAAAPAP